MYVKKLHIENVKGFESIRFDLERPDGSFAGWTVFVGGNSSGKSTLLKAIALSLIGPETGGRLIGSPLGWIRAGQSKALASLTLTRDSRFDAFKSSGKLPGDAFDAGVRWVRNKDDEVPQFKAVERRNARQGRVQTAERGPWSPNARGWFAAGYGPMRRLTGSSSESIRFAVSKEAESRFVTLFREDAALSESEEWLRRMYARSLESNGSRPEIQAIIGGVTALLESGLLPQGMKVSRITVDHVFIKDGRGVELPMRDISDGCRSVYATVLDIVHGLFEVYGADGLFEYDSEERPVVTPPGVVIIDEIEAHLHPAWQLEIPKWLKTHFPNIQFLVSTHSPLIAQAADPNGLFILPLQNDLSSQPRAASPGEYERIRLGTAHKTVLGVAFGLHTTRTQWALDRIQRWQELNAMKKSDVPMSASNKKEHASLRKQMLLAFDENPDGKDF